MSYRILLASFSLVTSSLLAIPVVTSITPNHGSTAGGNSVLIQGTGFSEVNFVKWGKDQPSTPFIVESDTQITLSAVPPGTPGAVNIQLQGSTSSSLVTDAGKYFYISPDGNNFGAVVLGCALCAGSPVDINPQVLDISVTPAKIAFSFTNTPFSALDGVAFPEAQSLYAFSRTSLIPTLFQLTLPNPPSLFQIGTDFQQIHQNIALDPASQFFLTGALASSTARSAQISFFSNPSGLPLASTNEAYFGISIKPNRKLAYMINSTTSSLVTLDTSSLPMNPHLPFVGTQTVVGGAFDMAITPTGTHAYVTTSEGYVWQYNTTSDSSPPTLSRAPVFIPNAASPGLGTIAITPNGQYAYVCVPKDARTGTGKVYPISIGNPGTYGPASLGTSATNLPLGATRITITPDGKKAFVACSDAIFGTVFGTSAIVELDIGTNPMAPTIVGIINSSSTPSLPANFWPTSIVITPDTGPFASFTATPTIDGVSFDASESFSCVGTVAKYEWDFGDGTTLNTTSPKTTHAYPLLQRYTATLKVTNSQGTSTQSIYNGKQYYAVAGNWAITSRTFSTGFVAEPLDLKGIQVKNQFLTQTDYVNILTWKVLKKSAATHYNVYRLDSAGAPVLIATVPVTKEQRVEDHDRQKGVSYTYQVVGVDQFGDTSAKVAVTIQGI